MKIIVAIDSFKGSGSAVHICELVEKGIKAACPQAEVVKIPMADGGEGTVDAFLLAAGGNFEKVRALDPLGREIDSFFGILKDNTAVIEMAAASGLPLLAEHEKNPLKVTTYGTGQLIKAALDKGAQKIILGLGGSATNDGGAGMAKALGFRLFDKGGNELSDSPEELLTLSHIDTQNADIRLKNCKFIAACDVTNPLCGQKGASSVFGPQKGASPDDVKLLDRALFHLAEVIKTDLGIDVSELPGGGAAGGLGAGAVAFLGAKLQSGIDIMLDAAKFEHQLSDADFVITGEGRIDSQSAAGKVPAGVARRTKSTADIPVFALAGGIGDGASDVYGCGIDSIITSTDRILTLEQAISMQDILIPSAAERLTRIMLACRKKEDIPY